MASQKNIISKNISGEEFPLPDKDEYQKEFDRLQKLADQARSEGREVVVVMGLGFVGGRSSSPFEAIIHLGSAPEQPGDQPRHLRYERRAQRLSPFRSHRHRKLSALRAS